MLNINDKVDGNLKGVLVTAEDQTGTEITLKDLWKTDKLVLYFYPKDNTPGCTTEAINFRESIKAFKDLGFRIIGVSKDPVKSHCKFIEKQDINFGLLSDESGEICDHFGLWVEKSMYGKKYMGIQRSTFLIEKGKIIHAVEKVKVKTHADDLLKAIAEL